ncbi:MAG: hypothetical protein Q9197_001228, partial [Variospora fuerteventurae]
MAVEAARQLWSSCISESSAVQITEVKVFETLPFSRENQSGGEVETQFFSNWDGQAKRMSFEIQIFSNGAADTWTLCCKGKLELKDGMVPKIRSGEDEVSGDPISLQKAQACYPTIFERLNELKMNSGTMQGTSASKSNSWQEYPIDPKFLGSLMSLGPIPILSKSLPAEFRLKLLEMVRLRFETPTLTAARFDIRTKSIRAGGADSTISIHCDGEMVMTGKLLYEAIEIMSHEPIISSLFFKSVSLPDITEKIDIQVMDIKTCLLLITHKWPMCDIRVGDIAEEAQKRVLGILTNQSPKEKRRFRSIILYRDVGAFTQDSRIRKIKEHDTTPPAHFTLAGPNDVTNLLHDQVHPFGLVCIQQSRTRLEQSHPHALGYMYEITGLDENQWTLCYVINQDLACLQQRQKVIFSPRSFPLMKGRNIPIEPEKVGKFAEESGMERYHAIVVDDMAKPIIASWSGGDLIPWLQHLMKYAESLLWVSRNSSASPSANVAGTLLRTLQAERPSLKVSWIVVDDALVKGTSILEPIEAAFGVMLLGSNELRLAVDGKKTLITRYLPDDDLSLATGVSLPHQVQDPLGDREYSLTIAAPKEPVVLSYEDGLCPAPSRSHYDEPNGNHETKLEDDTIRVTVTATSISGDDLVAYQGKIMDATSHDGKGNGSTQALGTFFTGEVQVSNNPRLISGTPVVGWTHGAHTSLVNVSEKNLYRIEGGNHAQGLADFASLATAMAVVDGHIRARREDHFQYVNVKGMLHEALMKVCRHMKVSIPELRTTRSPTFVIEVSSDDNVLVNNVPVNVTSYLDNRPSVFEDLWKSHTEFTTPWQSFRFQDHKAAFEQKGSVHARPTILTHGGDYLGLSHVPVHRPRHDLAATNGAYIIIGGLGGLGRYVCQWLVNQGATSLHIISRSGISTPEAQQLCSTLNRFPNIQLQVHLADACDRAAISSILSSIRGVEPIKAIINMIMLLSDAPLASMTGKEWDLALRVKIDSSNILHELTANDELETFILFSSIASVLGNRGQAGYNVGNAFLNALAEHRRHQGQVAVSIALGAMTDIGVLAALPDSDPASMADKLTRYGLSHLTTAHLDKILEAAFFKTRRQRRGKEMRAEDCLMVTGLEMFEKNADGSFVRGKEEEKKKKKKESKKVERLFWTELPEFSHLSTYRPPSHSSSSSSENLPLRERVAWLATTAAADDAKELKALVRAAVLDFLARTLGFEAESLDPGGKGLGFYGLDSLSAAGCQYWCFK